jgi:chaperonin cofactor prefoldin
VVEQSTQQHFLQHLSVLVQKLPKSDQKTLASLQELQEQIDMVLQKTKLLDQGAIDAQIQHEQHTEDLLQRIDHLEIEIREMRAGGQRFHLSQQQLQKNMDWVLDHLVHWRKRK